MSVAEVIWHWSQVDRHVYGVILRGETEVLVKKPVPVPSCPPKIVQGLTYDRTPASVEEGDVARPGIS